MLTLEIGKRVTYDGLSSIDNDKYYYLTDTSQLYKRGDLCSQIVRIVATESLSPYQGDLYVINGEVKTYNGSEWSVIGSAYLMGTNEIYTTEIAIQEASLHIVADDIQYAERLEYNNSDLVENTEDTKDEIKHNLTDNAYYTTSIYPDTLSSDPSTYDELSQYSINAISNIKTWESVSTDNSDFTIVENLDVIESPEEGQLALNTAGDSDDTVMYQYTDNEWYPIITASNLTDYYGDVNYVATPLDFEISAQRRTLTTVASIAEEEINAIDYIQFAQVSGAASTGVVSSPIIGNYSTDVATTAFVAAAISAATEQLQTYVDELTGLFDPIGSADRALETAINYVDQRLTWNRGM